MVKFTSSKDENEVEMDTEKKTVEQTVKETITSTSSLEKKVEVPEKKVEVTEKKVEITQQRMKKAFDIDKKIDTINASKMPDWQKEKYIKRLQPEPKGDGISFAVYARLRGFTKIVTDSMRMYPKAVNTGLASLEEWDKIFAEF